MKRGNPKEFELEAKKSGGSVSLEKKKKTCEVYFFFESPDTAMEQSASKIKSRSMVYGGKFRLVGCTLSFSRKISFRFLSSLDRK